MALADEVTSRFGSQFLIQITNPSLPSATTVDTTRLGLAATDVEADFEIYAGVEYDGTDARHISVAVEGVIATLIARTGTGGDSDRVTNYRERLKALALVTGRDRIMPATTSVLSPSSELSPDGEVTRPDFDRSRFDHLIPGGPAGDG